MVPVDPLDERSDALRVDDVEVYGFGTAGPHVLEGVGNCGQPIGVVVDDDDVGAALDERPTQGETDPGCSARDDGDGRHRHAHPTATRSSTLSKLRARSRSICRGITNRSRVRPSHESTSGVSILAWMLDPSSCSS
jgi:hypothetical protein